MIDKFARKGRGDAIDFPRIMLQEGSLDFSFSGLKSAVLNYLNSMKMKNEAICPEDVSASFQEALLDVLCAKIDLAAQKTGQKRLRFPAVWHQTAACVNAWQNWQRKRGIGFIFLNRNIVRIMQL